MPYCTCTISYTIAARESVEVIMHCLAIQQHKAVGKHVLPFPFVVCHTGVVIVGAINDNSGSHVCQERIPALDSRASPSQQYRTQLHQITQQCAKKDSQRMISIEVTIILDCACSLSSTQSAQGKRSREFWPQNNKYQYHIRMFVVSQLEHICHTVVSWVSTHRCLNVTHYFSPHEHLPGI